jgi:phosphoribosylanthranilate isomerase
MIIKLCGMKNSPDALFAVACGANAVGINFYPPSPRFVEERTAEQICAELEGAALRVGIFVGRPEQTYPFLDVLQIHGLEACGEVPQIFSGQSVWIACRPEIAPAFKGHMVVIDTSWGRGISFDWESLEQLAQPFVLSGGLNAGNVAAAIERLRPAGVDVCTGIESSPGVKDRGKMRAFLEAVRETDRSTLP